MNAPAHTPGCPAHTRDTRSTAPHLTMVKRRVDTVVAGRFSSVEGASLVLLLLALLCAITPVTWGENWPADDNDAAATDALQLSVSYMDAAVASALASSGIGYVLSAEESSTLSAPSASTLSVPSTSASSSSSSSSSPIHCVTCADLARRLESMRAREITPEYVRHTPLSVQTCTRLLRAARALDLVRVAVADDPVRAGASAPCYALTRRGEAVTVRLPHWFALQQRASLSWLAWDHLSGSATGGYRVGDSMSGAGDEGMTEMGTRASTSTEPARGARASIDGDEQHDVTVAERQWHTESARCTEEGYANEDLLMELESANAMENKPPGDMKEKEEEESAKAKESVKKENVRKTGSMKKGEESTTKKEKGMQKGEENTEENTPKEEENTNTHTKENFYGRLAASGDGLQRLFAESMRELTEVQLPQLLALPVWADCVHVVDVGGGSGALVAGLLRAHPHLRSGVVRDCDPVALREARARFGALGLLERASAVYLDMFAATPVQDHAVVQVMGVRRSADGESSGRHTLGEGEEEEEEEEAQRLGQHSGRAEPLVGHAHTCVVMKGITSDYDDRALGELLRRVWESSQRSGADARHGDLRLVVLDHFFSEEDSAAQTRFKHAMDIMMLSALGGRQRHVRREFAPLLATATSSRCAVHSVLPTRCGVVAVVAECA
jgi:O-methyltransferase domain